MKQGFLGTIGWIKGNLMSNPNLLDKNYNNENFYPGAPDIPNSGADDLVKLEWIGFRSAIPAIVSNAIVSKKVKTGANISWSWTAQISKYTSGYYNTVGGGAYTNSKWNDANVMQVTPNGNGVQIIYGYNNYKSVSCDIFKKHTYTFQGGTTRKFKIDGVDQFTMSSSTFSGAQPFGIWHGQPISKYYMLEIYQDGELVEKIVPVLKGGKPYFMDEIDGTMYEIKTEDFVTNLDVEKGIVELDYIECTRKNYVYSTVSTKNANWEWTWTQVGTLPSSYDDYVIGASGHGFDETDHSRANIMQFFSGNINTNYAKGGRLFGYSDFYRKHTYKFENKKWYIDDSQVASTTNTMSGDPIAFCVFRPKYRGRWHKCIVKDENLNIVEHWTPVLNKGVPFLLDKVNNRMQDLGLVGTDYDYGI